MMVNLLRSELRKTLTVKLWWTMGLAPLAIGLLAGSLSLALFGGLSGTGSLSAQAGGIVGLFTAIFALLLFSALFGAVNASGEYRHRTITTTFLTTNSRGRSLLAKLSITALVGLLYAVVIEAVTIGSVAVLAGDSARLNSAMFRFLAAGVAVTILWTLVGAGLGILLGNSVAAAVGIVVYYVLGELLLSSVLSSLGAPQLSQFLPQQSSLAAMVNVDGQLFGSLSWWGGLLTMAASAGLLCGGGWVRNRVRDVG